ncbi:MAG TPA: phospholipase D family protein [Nitrospirota bacterium]|nr:phospholipase D family protein [Nitrospirota bacterium]
MKTKLILILFILVLPITLSAKDLTLSSALAQVFFSPRGGCTEAIAEALNKAKSEVLVQAYSFTSKPMAKALVDAHKRGVHVEIILDKSNKSSKYNAGDFMAHAGIPTYIDSAHVMAHNKVIDNEVVITGSFNFTRAAEEHNAENLLIIHSKELAKDYSENWQNTRGIAIYIVEDNNRGFIGSS